MAKAIPRKANVAPASISIADSTSFMVNLQNGAFMAFPHRVGGN
jgi:hypothetical protein